MAIGLYVHFPFCRTKCPYCHFASVPLTTDLYREWWEGLKRETSRRSREKLEFDTLYLGGGTPSLLAPDDLYALRELLDGSFWLALDEFTLEANPGTADGEAMREWKEAGVTRLSIGIQSFDDTILRTLDRGYSAADAESFSETAQAAGFESLSIDLLIGVPGENRAMVGRTLDKTIRLAPDHVSLYILENVEGLPFEKTLERNPVDEDAVADAYLTVRDRLAASGLRQYEISNFARPGKECRHNLKYWRYEPFLGLGPSACSHLGMRRWCNSRSLAEWAGALRESKERLEEEVTLTPETAFTEALIFGLRLAEGVDVDELADRFGADVGDRRRRNIDELVAEGSLARQGSRLRIPPDNFLVSNPILSQLL